MTRIALGSYDAAEALEAILKHEKIGYERGVGPGSITFDVTSDDSLIVAQRLNEWTVALFRVVNAFQDLPPKQVPWPW